MQDFSDNKGTITLYIARADQIKKCIDKILSY